MQTEPSYVTKYTKPAVRAQNYADINGDPRQQGFWMVYMPHANKIKVLYPNYSPILLTLPKLWEDGPLLFFVGCQNRASVRLVTVPGNELTFKSLQGQKMGKTLLSPLNKNN